jgi:hypothetical protein
MDWRLSPAPRGQPAIFNAYKEMTCRRSPGLGGRARAAPQRQAGIQSAFQCYNINSFETVER